MTKRQKQKIDKVLAYIIFYGGSFAVLYGAFALFCKFMVLTMNWILAGAV